MPITRPNKEINLRRPLTTDLDQLVNIERRCFRAHRFSRRQFRYYIHENPSIFAAAEVDGRLVGYIAGTVLRERTGCAARLYSMAVLPRWRGIGIGAALLTYFERRAARQKCSSIVLQVRQTNRPARALYRKFGYEPEATRADYYGPGKTGLQLRKSLKGEA